MKEGNEGNGILLRNKNWIIKQSNKDISHNVHKILNLIFFEKWQIKEKKTYRNNKFRYRQNHISYT